MEEKEARLKGLRGEHDAVKAEVLKLQANEVDLQHSAEEHERSLKDNQVGGCQYVCVSGTGLEENEAEAAQVATAFVIFQFTLFFVRAQYSILECSPSCRA